MFNLFRSFRVLLIVYTGLSLGGCIEITEEITIEKDESGSVTYRISSPAAGGLLSGLLSMIDPDVERGIVMETEKLIRVLKSQKGISNIRYSLQGGQDGYFVTFDFADCTDFNTALYAMGGAKRTFLSPDYMKISKRRFKKFNFTPSLKRYLDREGLALPAPALSSNVTFRSTVHTPRDIRKVKNGTRKDTRTSVQRFRISDILDGKANTGINVRY